MEFINRLSTSIYPEQIMKDLITNLSGPYDMGFLFISGFSQSAFEEIVVQLRKNLNIRHLLGCSCAGIIGSQQEIEGKPACSLIVGKLPGAKISSFVINNNILSELTTNEDWYKFFEVYPNENPHFIILPDPLTFDIFQFLPGANQSYPRCPIIGGLASGGSNRNSNFLILDDTIYTESMVGIVLTGDIKLATIVSQGCRPIGETYIVTKAKDNIVYELGGRPMVEVLLEVLSKASARDKLLAQEAVFVGIAMNEYKDEFKRGDFLIRGVMGIDDKIGAGAIADYVKVGQTVQFHVRDAETATEDLNSLIKAQQQLSPNQKPKGALIFSCNGRGLNMFREKNHDINLIQQHIGLVNAAGFFCAGEIGPVAGSNFLHGFTSSIALFYSP